MSMEGAPPQSKNYYDVLEVSPEASKEEITRAFRAKLRGYRFKKGVPTETFDELSRAFKALTNPEARGTYDAQLIAELEQSIKDENPEKDEETRGEIEALKEKLFKAAADREAAKKQQEGAQEQESSEGNAETGASPEAISSSGAEAGNSNTQNTAAGGGGNNPPTPPQAGTVPNAPTQPNTPPNPVAHAPTGNAGMVFGQLKKFFKFLFIGLGLYLITRPFEMLFGVAKGLEYTEQFLKSGKLFGGGGGGAAPKKKAADHGHGGH